MDKKRSINVLMPYSSKLRKFSEWFVQLWGESLGKQFNNKNEEIFFGNTPIAACGANDQHSMLQLFREGPDDKLVTFIGIESHPSDFDIKNTISEDFKYLESHKLSELLNIEAAATEAALRLSGRPSIRLNLKTLDEQTLGELFMLYQYVVAIIGLANDVNPFNQPGVEDSKTFVSGLMGRPGYEAKKTEFEELYSKNDEFIV